MSAATPGQAAREALEATFRRTYALHPNDFHAKFEQARDAVMGAADTYAQAVAQADLLERLRTVLLDLRTNPTEARIQALHLLDAAASPPALAGMQADDDDFVQDRHADLDAGENGGAMTDADYYDRIAEGDRRDALDAQSLHDSPGSDL